MLCTNIAYLPVFILMNDWGRWFSALFIVGFLDIMLLAGDEDEGVCYAFEKFEGLNFPEQVTDFYYTTYNLKNWLLHR